MMKLIFLSACLALAFTKAVPREEAKTNGYLLDSLYDAKTKDPLKDPSVMGFLAGTALKVGASALLHHLRNKYGDEPQLKDIKDLLKKKNDAEIKDALKDPSVMGFLAGTALKVGASALIHHLRNKYGDEPQKRDITDLLMKTSDAEIRDAFKDPSWWGDLARKALKLGAKAVLTHVVGDESQTIPAQDEFKNVNDLLMKTSDAEIKDAFKDPSWWGDLARKALKLGAKAVLTHVVGDEPQTIPAQDEFENVNDLLMKKNE